MMVGGRGSEMTDIVERLRDWMTIDQTTSPASRMAEAAYEIQSLRQQLAECQYTLARSHANWTKSDKELTECQANETRRAKLLDDAESVIVRQREERLEAIKSAKREAFFEAADYIEKQSLPDVYSERCLDEFARDIRNMET
jgi:septal ring factor EnvC (AmiA/AmiB activator)